MKQAAVPPNTLEFSRDASATFFCHDPSLLIWKAPFEIIEVGLTV